MSGDRFADDFSADWENDPLAADERLADYVDDQLDERDRDRFEAELRVSPRLREQLEQYQRTVAVVQQALRAPTQPTQLADRVMAALASEAARPSLVRRQLRPFLFAAASAAALLALALVVDRLGSPEPSQRTDFASAPPGATQDAAEQGWEGGSTEQSGNGAAVALPMPELAAGAKPLAEELEQVEAAPADGARRDSIEDIHTIEPAEQPNQLRLEQARNAGDDSTPVKSARAEEHAPRTSPVDADKSAESGEPSRTRGGARPKSNGGLVVAPDTPRGGTGGREPNEAQTPGGGGGGGSAPRPVKPGAPAGPSTGGPAGPVTGGAGSFRSVGGGAGGPGTQAPEPATGEGAVPTPGAVRSVPDALEGLHTDGHEEAKDSLDRAVTRKGAGGGESKDAPRQGKVDGDSVGDREFGSEREPKKKPLSPDAAPSAPRLAVRGERAARLPVVTIELRGVSDAANPALQEKTEHDQRRSREPLSEQGTPPQAGRSGDGTKSEPVALAELLAGFVADESQAIDKLSVGAEVDSFFLAPAPAPRRIGGLLLMPFGDAPAQAPSEAGAASRDWLVSGSRAELEQLMREVARFAAARGGRLSTGEVGVVGASDVAADAAPPAETADRGGAVEPRRRMVLRFRHP